MTSIKGKPGETQTEWRLRLALHALERISKCSDSLPSERLKFIATNAITRDDFRSRVCPEHGRMIKSRSGNYFCTACSAEDG